MVVLSPLLVATAAIELWAALLFALAFLRRSAERQFGVAALLCLASAEHAVAWALGEDRAAWFGLIAAAPIVVQFAIVYRGGSAPARVRAALAGAAGLLVVLDLRGALDAGAMRACAFAAAGAAAGAAIVIVARAYLGGQREALGVVVGATLLTAAMAHDAGVASGLWSTGYLADVGLAAFAIGIASTQSARYVAVTRELERRTRDLRSRTRELRRSYESLRTTQEELVKKEQLAVVGELAAVIAHEVRNPLAVITNATSNLRKTGITREDHDTLLSILDEETLRLNRLVGDLLRYARPVSVQRSHIKLDDLLARPLALAQSGAKSIRTQLEIDCHEPTIWGDANLLRQVFDNLIDNAVEAMHPGGLLTVRMRATTENGIDGIAVDIIDTGEGMDTQVRSRARDPFFTTRPSGTGLGLAIVDRIVDAHGGQFAIDSRTGEGTTVSVFLPHGSASEPPPPPRSRRASSDPARLDR